MKIKQVVSIILCGILLLASNGCGNSKKYEEQNAQNLQYAKDAYENLNAACPILDTWGNDLDVAWRYGLAYDDYSFKDMCNLLSGVTKNEVFDGFMAFAKEHTTDGDKWSYVKI